MVYSELSQFCIATALSISIYKDILEKQNRMLLKERLVILSFCFLLPFLLILIGFEFGIFGPNGHWCWISKEYNESFGVAFYLIVWLFILVNILFLIMSLCKIQRHKKDHSRTDEEVKEEKLIVKQMTIFPILLIVCWIFPTIDRVRLFCKYEKIQFIEVVNLTGILLLGVLISIFSFLFIFWNKFNFFHILRLCCVKLFSRRDRRESEAELLANITIKG